MSETPEGKGRRASLADAAKLHAAKRQARKDFEAADQDYRDALRRFEASVIAKDAARQHLADVSAAYDDAKAEAGE